MGAGQGLHEELTSELDFARRGGVYLAEKRRKWI